MKSFLQGCPRMKPFQQGNLQDWKYLSRSRVNHVYVVAIADVYVVAIADVYVVAIVDVYVVAIVDVYVVAIVDVYALSINEGWMH